MRSCDFDCYFMVPSVSCPLTNHQHIASFTCSTIIYVLCHIPQHLSPTLILMNVHPAVTNNHSNPVTSWWQCADIIYVIIYLAGTPYRIKVYTGNDATNKIWIKLRSSTKASSWSALTGPFSKSGYVDQPMKNSQIIRIMQIIGTQTGRQTDSDRQTNIYCWDHFHIASTEI